jgi:hypothetical protein
VAAGVAAVAVVALQQRAVAPTLRAVLPTTAQSSAAAQNREALSYTVPTAPAGAPAGMPAARLTNYMFAHSKYSSPLGQRGVLADLLIEDDEQQAAGNVPAVNTAP